jgi:hypothetical protein
VAQRATSAANSEVAHTRAEWLDAIARIPASQQPRGARTSVLALLPRTKGAGFALEPRVSSKDSRGKPPPNPEAQKVAPAAEGIPEAAGGPEVQWTADPGTAANDTLQVIL